MAKPKLKEKARILRQEGISIKKIAAKLQVSSSTVSLWCKDIKLTKEQIAELERRYRDPYYGRRLENVLLQQKKRAKRIELLKKQGIKELGKLSKRETLIAGTALYWAEGFKKDNRLGFANSDPAMVKFFLKWLTENCKVPKADIRLRVGLNIDHKNRTEEIEDYWSKLTKISRDQFQQPFFQKYTWKKIFPNSQDYHGVLRIRANKQLSLFRKIHGWIEGLRLNSYILLLFSLKICTIIRL